MDFFISNGYLSVMQKEDYDQASAEVSNLTQMNIDLANAENADRSAKDRSGRRGEENPFNNVSF